ncbi:MAG TPA: hypothetical protein VIF62_14680 [Labilithrix sp.]
MKKLASPFVMTLGLVACGKSAAPQAATATTVDVPPPENPPSPIVTPIVADASASASPPPDPWKDAPSPGDYPKGLNATDAQGRIVYRSYGDKLTCFVQLPWPKGQPRMPGMMKTQDAPCPPSMQTDAWKQCPGGTIASKKDSATDCGCFQGGNPPPIPHKVPCP